MYNVIKDIDSGEHKYMSAIDHEEALRELTYRCGRLLGQADDVIDTDARCIAGVSGGATAEDGHWKKTLLEKKKPFTFRHISVSNSVA